MKPKEVIDNIAEIQGIITDAIPVCDPEDDWERYTITLSIAKKALEKQISRKPIIWDERTHYTPGDWGYECPCCGTRDIDYPDHHCKCGQAIDWE